jgi:alcohol dehydrogenase
VLVVGGHASSIGLYAVACALRLGSTDVLYLDPDRERLGIAARFGARLMEGPYRPASGPFPITVDASADAVGLAAALQSTEPGGVCTSVGIYYEARTPVPLRRAYGIGLTFITGRVNSRAVLPEVLELLAAEPLDGARAMTRVARWEDAVEALLEPSAKVVVARPSP